MKKRDMSNLRIDGYFIETVNDFYHLWHEDEPEPYVAKRNHVREFKTTESIGSLLNEFGVHSVELRL